MAAKTTKIAALMFMFHRVLKTADFSETLLTTRLVVMIWGMRLVEKESHEEKEEGF